MSSAAPLGSIAAAAAAVPEEPTAAAAAVPEEPAVPEAEAFPLAPRQLRPEDWTTAEIVEIRGGGHAARVCPVAPLVVLKGRLELVGGGEFAFLEISKKDAKAFEGVEDWVVAHALAHSQDWFGRDIPLDTLKTAFRTCVSSSSDHGSKLKLDATEAAAFTLDETETDLADLVAAGAGHAEVVLELSEIRFASACFGAMWKLVQAQETVVLQHAARKKIQTKKPAPIANFLA